MTPGARPRGAEEGEWRDPSKSPKITLRGPWTGENREIHFPRRGHGSRRGGYGN